MKDQARTIQNSFLSVPLLNAHKESFNLQSTHSTLA